MGRTLAITCDACGADLTSAGPMPAYRLSLCCEQLTHKEAVIFLVHVIPPLDREHNFCGIGCLEKWLERRKAEKA